jgi:secreted pullulanase
MVLTAGLMITACSKPEPVIVPVEQAAFIVEHNQILLSHDDFNDNQSIEVWMGDGEVSVENISKEDSAVRITTSADLDITQTVEVRSADNSIHAKPHWKFIDRYFSYDGNLGLEFGDGSVTFRIWAPIASNIIMDIYDNPQGSPIQSVELERGEKGVWSYSSGQDLNGKFYSYKVTNYGETKDVLDPYAFSMSANYSRGFEIGKAAVVNPFEIGPELDYAEIDGYEKREDAIIWEIHVRDFTSDIDLNIDAQFGTYDAFAEQLDYIDQLGVTHIQLLPVMNYATGNETDNVSREWEYKLGANYNWGYDPHSYFAPEGMYSTEPENPETRIQELKALVQAIHEKGMGVTLDVVYNHTARVSIFEDIVPGYYHFMEADGDVKESYGGGRLGSTHYMARKLIIDSIIYWMEAYKVDGYRFDLMGDLDGETIQQLYDAALEMNPNVHMVGECWRTFAGDDGEEVTPSDQDWMDQTNSVACFSDEMRNEVKSGYGSEGEQRFITGGARSVDTIFNNIIAKPGNTTEDDPGDILQYVAAHDNLTLHDVIAYSANLDPTEKQEEIQRRIRLGNTIILTSQGVAFIHAGQEYGRTKVWLGDDIPQSDETYVEGFTNPYFIHNSYDASDIVNHFDWDKVTDEGIHRQTMEFTRGLIELRRSTDAFTLGTEELIAENVKRINSPDIQDEDLIIAFEAQSTDGDIFTVIINADRNNRTVRINKDLTGSGVIADNDEVSVNGVESVSGIEISEDQISIEGLSIAIFKN